MLKLLNSFYHCCAQHIAHEPIQQLPNGSWHTPCLATILKKYGLFSVGHYIQYCKDTMSSFVQGHPIYDLCINSAPMVINAN